MSDEPILVPHLEELEGITGLEEAAADLYPRVLETICGATDDSQPVEQYDGSLGVTQQFVNANQPMVAQVQWNATLPYTNPGNVAGVRWGTGTMISADLFLTAGHLFDQTGGGWERPRVNGTSNVISPQEIATRMHVNFNYQVDPQGNLRQEQSFAITQLLEYRLGGLDFAICRIAGSPGTTFGVAEVATADAAQGDMLAIIGHPAGVPKRIEAGPLTAFDGDRVTYGDIDTLGGNSGSGILQASTGRIIGVHTNGGCTRSGGANYGVRISAIRSASPTLRSFPVATSPLADQLGTSLRDDLLNPTGVVADTLGHTGVIADRLGTSVLRDLRDTLKLRDDLRTDPTRDFNIPVGTGFGRDVLPDPIGPVVDPVISPGRPFVLATPHHTTAGIGEAAAPAEAEYLTALTQLEAAIGQSEADLSALVQQYAALREEYEAQFGG